MTTSPYLLRPLRNLAQAMEDIEQRRRRAMAARAAALIDGEGPAEATAPATVAPATPQERRRLIRLVG